MQAPTTTEGGLAGRDPQAPVCPACGATNISTAAFCWQCFRTIGAEARTARHSPAGPAAWPPAPVPPGPFEATQPRTSRLGLLSAVVAVALGVVAGIAFVALRQDPVAFPDSFAGLTRAVDAQTDAASASFRTAADADGLDADMAFYGEGGPPVAALAWIRGADRTPSGVDGAFDAFGEGFTSGSNGAVLSSERLERTVDGVEYVCASVDGPVAAGLCLWQDADVFWVLMDVRPGTTIDETERLAVTAADATS